MRSPGRFDGARSLRGLRERGEELGGDRSRVGLVGGMGGVGLFLGFVFGFLFGICFLVGW